jgi:hypothetical protein
VQRKIADICKNTNQTKGDYIMTTFNIETAIPTGKFHKRQTGLWGQLLASAEIERKLARVENKCREIARDGKEDVGGYLQYMTQDVAGILLREMHKQIGKEVRRNRTVKNVILKRTNVVFDIGGEMFDTADYVKKAGGLPVVNGFAVEDSKIKKLYDAMLNRNYPVTRETLMKDAGIKSVGQFHVTLRDLRLKGFDIETVRSKHRSLSPKYQIAS